MQDRMQALVHLGRALEASGYRFVTPTPETHRRVDARARTDARDLRDVFGWSRPFVPSVLPPDILALARAADVVAAEGDRCRARVRFSTLHGRLFVHAAYPTLAPDSVFFGPDTYRYCDLVALELGPARRVVDIGCGSGAGGIVAAARAERVVLADVNPKALAYARVNAELAGVGHKVEIVESDVLRGVERSIDAVIVNPSYLVDPKSRAYRDGGGTFGEALAVRIVRESVARLPRGGQLVLYTGAAIVRGEDTFFGAIRDIVRDMDVRYRELDPDVFGEEIEQNDAYAEVERIAVVALVATQR